MQKIFLTIKLTAQNLWTTQRSKVVWGAIIGVLVILTVWGIAHKKGPETMYTVATANITDTVMLSGRTESLQDVNLGFADSGRVAHVYVREGDRVKQGQILADLEMGDLVAQYQSARAGVTIATANLKESRSNVDRVTREQNALVETAKRNLYGNLEAYPDDAFLSQEAPDIYGSYQGDTAGSYVMDIYGSNAITGASIRYSGLETGTTALTVDNRVALGIKGLYIQFTSTQGYLNSTWTVPVPNNRSSSYASLNNAYETALAARDRAIENARAETVGDMSSVLQAKLDQAQSSLSQIGSAMTRRRITAPFSGTISKVALKQGESTVGIAKDTSPGVSMLATDYYKVVVKIPEIDVARVSPNIPVNIVLDAYGPDVTFVGTLATINPAETIVDGVPVYEGTVLFTERDDRIRSGMTATVNIVTGDKHNVVAIPGNYIRSDKVARKSFVTVVDPANNKKTIERAVTTGIRGSDGMTEITSGLSAGEMITGIVEQK